MRKGEYRSVGLQSAADRLFVSLASKLDFVKLNAERC
jgi:hypothetical protein